MTKFILNYTILISLFFSGLSVFGQTGSISGKVSDANGKALSYATVEVLNAQIGANTDEEGNFTLTDVPAGAAQVKASYLGYAAATQEITVVAGQSVNVTFALASDALNLDDVVITGVANAKSKLESSVSISTLSPQTVNQIGAVTTTEIFRAIPGIRSESSGGEGNTNITARGVPISAGGSKYLQLQEDGLPILLFGDISFATSDIFLRADQTIARVEAIRGGSASTLASNSPAGIINFISKTGGTAGGSVGMTVGLGYNNLRTDFQFGAPIGEGWSFNIGGFVRQGDGVRTAGYTANQGGQFKANLTKNFKNGYARVYYKFLNDKAIAYMPMPAQVEGTNTNPTWGSVPGFSAQLGAMQSTNLMQNLGLGPDGQIRRSNVQDGMHPESNAVGTEFSFDLGDGWKMEDRARLSFNKGRFISPFPSSLGTAASIAPKGTTLMYLGDSVAFTQRNNTNGLAMRLHMFDTELNNFNNMMNDFKVSKEFSFASGKVNFAAGYFKAFQNISMSWLWNTYFTDVNGNGTRLLNVITDSTGANQSDNGLFAYGVPEWGNCCQRNFDMGYDISAPHASLALDLDNGLSLDGSWRWDMGHATGRFAGAVQTQYDMNNDGVISQPEKSVSAINNSATTPVDYKYNYMSYSLGANYKLDEKQAIFARYSKGGSAKADRILFSGLNYTDGKKLNAIDLISQAEMGYKKRGNNYGLFATAFYAATNEQGGFEATTQKLIINDYRAFGLELEGSYNVGGFDLRGGATFTNARITNSADTSVIGKTPRRQAGLIFQLMPSYTYKQFSVGLTIYGTTKSFAQDINKLVLPGYASLNGFVRYNIAKGLSIGVNGNNLLNTLGITEVEEGSITENAKNYLRARSIIGRSMNASVRYDF